MTWTKKRNVELTVHVSHFGPEQPTLLSEFNLISNGNKGLFYHYNMYVVTLPSGTCAVML